ncbi:hypothetical protein BGZ51_003864 [Haplosporangium sp. Z 767]|nr:hypothetical protein BGZ51_003864 [Haplosporangium sp. Z 767]
MADLTLFCLIDGEPTSRAFSLSAPLSQTISGLKELIKTENAVKFIDVDANDLTLWQVSIPVLKDDELPIVLDALNEKKKLGPITRLSKLFTEKPPKKTIHIIVQRPPQDLEFMPKNKRIRIIEGWKPYKASNGESVDLPLSWIELLEGTELEPEPREAFKHLKDRLEAGQAIDIPNLGQVPKEFERRNSKHKFFVTEQMLELWKDICSEKNRTYRRILSGPMGVGKSYLSYFLAARAYAEGWPVLYILDAGKLDTERREQSEMEVVKRFLAINKDILTAAELEKLVGDYDDKYDISIDAISVIFEKLLKTRERKTLLLVDEHRKLFQREPYVPVKFKSLNHLSSYALWGEEATGSRLIFTGTAHAKYEMTVLDDCYRQTSVVLVGPLSRNVFSNLLDTYPCFKAPAIKKEVTYITNCVPRELVYLSAAVEHLPDPISVNNLQEWMESRTKDFLSTAEMYYEGCSQFMKNDFYKNLLQTFLGNTSAVNFDCNFMDLGLVYLSKDVSKIETQYHILCRPAQKALLELFKTLPLPNGTRKRIRDGSPSEEDFETALCHQLICATKPIVLNATDLNNNHPSTIVMNFVDCNTIESPNVSHDKVLCRGYEGYPRFDFMLGPMFIQVSICDFASHNEFKTADITKAFSKAPGEENQIERYLNEVYGPGHSAKIDNNRFVVTRADVTGGGVPVPVPGFRIVYIRGSPGKPAHRVLVEKFPDVVHVTFEELQEKLFKNIL